MQSLAGTYRLIEALAFDEEGRELPPPFGPCPMGIAMIDAERMIVAVSDGRHSLPPDVQSRAFIAFTGKYHFDGTMFVTTVDGASSSDVAKEQIRHIRFESPTRMCITPKNTVLGQTAGLKVIWERFG